MMNSPFNNNRNTPFLPNTDKFFNRRFVAEAAVCCVLSAVVLLQVKYPLTAQGAEVLSNDGIHHAQLASSHTSSDDLEWIDADKNLSIRVTEDAEHQTASVVVNQKEVMKFRSDWDDYSPVLRAKKAAHTLFEYIHRGGQAIHIFPKVEDDSIQLVAGNHVVADIDPQTAELSQNEPKSLALVWSNLTRTALGAQKLFRSKTNQNEFVDASQYHKTGKVSHGKASWYGPGFHGRKTADGSRFDMNGLTAAHKTLPFGTLLQVTNERNGKTCVVKVNDRGPYAGHRILDLSKGAATQLGMLGSGVAAITMEVVTASPQKPLDIPHIEIPEFEATLTASSEKDSLNINENNDAVMDLPLIDQEEQSPQTADTTTHNTFRVRREDNSQEESTDTGLFIDDLQPEADQPLNLSTTVSPQSETQKTVSFLDGQLQNESDIVISLKHNDAQPEANPLPDRIQLASNTKTPPEPNAQEVLDDILKGEIILAPAVVEEQIKKKPANNDFDKKIKPIIDGDTINTETIH